MIPIRKCFQDEDLPIKKKTERRERITQARNAKWLNDTDDDLEVVAQLNQ